MKRLTKRYIFSEWVPTSVDDPNAIQYVTDVMAMGTEMQIQYQDGGYRTIFPYGWNTSQDGNILIMCYKDDGDVRSYRLDRIQQFVFDSSVMEQYESEQDSDGLFEEQDYQTEEFPSLPDDGSDDEQVVQELPFDDAIDLLEEENYEENFEEEYEEPRAASVKFKRLVKKGD